MPPNKFVKSLELIHVTITKPLSHLGELCADWALLISIETLNFQIALISEEIYNLVDCLVIDGLDVAAISLGQHFWIVLSDVVVVNSVFDKWKCNELLLLKLLPLLLVSNVLYPPCLSRRIYYLLPFIHLYLFLSLEDGGRLRGFFLLLVFYCGFATTDRLSDLSDIEK